MDVCVLGGGGGGCRTQGHIRRSGRTHGKRFERRVRDPVCQAGFEPASGRVADVTGFRRLLLPPCTYESHRGAGVPQDSCYTYCAHASDMRAL